MGEAAEMMLDGTCCVQCGDYLGGEVPGFPRSCASCERDERYQPRVARFDASKIKPRKPRDNETSCPHCQKTVKKVGLPHHILDKHPGALL